MRPPRTPSEAVRMSTQGGSGLTCRRRRLRRKLVHRRRVVQHRRRQRLTIDCHRRARHGQLGVPVRVPVGMRMRGVYREDWPGPPHRRKTRNCRRLRRSDWEGRWRLHLRLEFLEQVLPRVLLQRLRVKAEMMSAQDATANLQNVERVPPCGGISPRGGGGTRSGSRP